ncbi:MAG TPA: hypothetical protein VFY29_10115, partial [Terriglobia bacterium]|nr:hypothetical protein [Terriglobia bacterium]
ERRKHLYLYAGQHPVFLFSQNVLNYEGLGQARQLSQEANFAYLLGELRRRCSNAVYDDRLLNRQTLAHLIGPGSNPDADLDVAILILSRALGSLR